MESYHLHLNYFINTRFIEGCPIHPHRNGPYKPCVDPYGWKGSTTGGGQQWFMVYRTRNITFGVRLSWFLRLCWFMVYRTRNITVGVCLSCRADRNNEMHAPYECGSIGHV